MKPISPTVHGVLDYVTGAYICAAPWLLNFHDVRVARWTFVLMGLTIIGYSLVTEYKLGLPGYRAMPFTHHLAVDVIGAVLLISSPWILGYSEAVSWPPVIVGLVEIGVVLMTPWRRVPVDRTWHERPL